MNTYLRAIGPTNFGPTRPRPPQSIPALPAIEMYANMEKFVACLTKMVGLLRQTGCAQAAVTPASRDAGQGWAAAAGELLGFQRRFEASLAKSYALSLRGKNIGLVTTPRSE
jgi:hypothetical protein